MAARRESTVLENRRITVALSCSACGSRNYKTSKAARDGSPPLKLKKFCTHCKQHTLHVEGR